MSLGYHVLGVVMAIGMFRLTTESFVVSCIAGTVAYAAVHTVQSNIR
jgi:hypothetical protein